MDARRILSRGLLPLLALLTSVGGGAVQAATQQVPPGYREVALRHGVPPESLYSVALAETSMAPKSIVSVTRGAGPAPDVERPWPWTINVAGIGYRYASRLQAWEALQRFLKTHPRKRIDVGIAQVNLGWNGHHFTSTWEAFDPYTNLNAAAAILRECYDRNPGSWLVAAGCYHHPAGGAPAARYKAIVSRKLARLNGIASSPNPMPAARPVATVALTWIEPRSQ
ncbi:transglycosylase SLT domain-containing protein [Serratia ureilytica]|uniref:transglycosylase SLT domain-containing protein n=1 Tax=Serratia ureilytica TaxID=300181 RepID=UPI0019D17ADA|nr:transglycosylase SLT domain-containing protein [Serratia ureilytica]MBN5215740.1 transglycosylase SLT domain-containing protein [Serratia ureilytica]